MRTRRRSAGWIIFTAAVAAIAAGPSQAAPLRLADGALEIQIPRLDNVFGPLPIGLGQPVSVSVSDATGGFQLPGSVFGPTTFQATPGLTTSVGTIRTITYRGVANGPLSFDGANGTAMGALTGAIDIQILQFFPLPIPLSGVGSTGSVMTTPSPIVVTVVGQRWTTGVAQVTGITTTTPGTNVVNTITLAGNDLRTPGHLGSMTLVSGFKAVTNVGGTLGGFARMSLSFEVVPEPGTLALLAAGLGALCAGLRRRRH